MKNGAYDYLTKPFHVDEINAVIGRALEKRALVQENVALKDRVAGRVRLAQLLGKSKAMQQVFELIGKIHSSRTNVLITGESGTGKELVARALHAAGPFPDAPFLAINCAAIPHELLESSLFGHVRGSFTGADRDQPGLFVAAGQGTVFLDEIGEMPAATQAKLLRAIENKEVLPVGAIRPSPVRARVVAATNKDLPAEVAAGRFRPDLFYRLNVVAIRMPPLRDRPEDVPDLVAHLLAKHARALAKRVDGVDNETIRRLMSAPWRGNVRELDNALERAVILGDGPILTPEDFPAELVGPPDPLDPDAPDPGDDLRAALARAERAHIRRVLARCNNDKREAARRLGMGLSSLYRKLEEYQ
jgi:DNA-binding NtrC family response regulator